MNRRDVLVSAALVATTLVWGSAFTGIKFLVQVLGPFDLAVLRFVFAAPGYALTLLILARTDPRGIRLTPRQTLAVAAAGLLAVVSYHVSLNVGADMLTRTESRDAVALFTSFLISTTTLFTVLLVPLVTHEHLGPRRITGVLVGLVGVAVLLLWGRGVTSDPASLVGMLVVLGAPLSWAAYTVILKRFLRGVPLLAATSYAMLFGTALLLPLASDRFIPEVLAFTPALWGWAMLLSVGAVFGAYLVWGWALEHWDSSRVASFVYLSPLFATVVATTLGGESITVQFVAGAVLILTGVAIANSSRQAPARGGAPISS